MNNYSQREKQEFNRLLEKVLEIKRNIENNHYLTKPISERDRLIMLESEQITEYYNSVPLDIKREHEKKHKINLGELIDRLSSVKD